MKMSEPFAIKFIESMFTSMNKTWISSTVNWMIDSRYRKVCDLRAWLLKQIELCNNSITFHDYYNACILSIPFKHRDHPDKIIVDILKFVCKTIRYQTDSNNFGYIENWEDITVTIDRGKGDCENMNTLVYVLALIAGIPSFLLWPCIGKTHEGHYWLMYFSSRRGHFYSIDSTFQPNRSYLNYRAAFKVGADYTRLDYIFNTDYIMKPR